MPIQINSDKVWQERILEEFFKQLMVDGEAVHSCGGKGIDLMNCEAAEMMKRAKKAQHMSSRHRDVVKDKCLDRIQGALDEMDQRPWFHSVTTPDSYVNNKEMPKEQEGRVKHCVSDGMFGGITRHTECQTDEVRSLFRNESAIAITREQYNSLGLGKWQ